VNWQIEISKASQKFIKKNNILDADVLDILDETFGLTVDG